MCNNGLLLTPCAPCMLQNSAPSNTHQELATSMRVVCYSHSVKMVYTTTAEGALLGLLHALLLIWTKILEIVHWMKVTWALYMFCFIAYSIAMVTVVTCTVSQPFKTEQNTDSPGGLRGSWFITWQTVPENCENAAAVYSDCCFCISKVRQQRLWPVCSRACKRFMYICACGLMSRYAAVCISEIKLAALQCTACTYVVPCFYNY